MGKSSENLKGKRECVKTTKLCKMCKVCSQDQGKENKSVK